MDWWEKAVQDLKPYWEIDTADKQVRLQRQPTWWKRLYLRWIKRFTVKELYAWMQSSWDSFQLISFPTGIKHDDFKISKDLERIVPRGYQLQGGWTIREADLKYLVRGPLLSEDGQRLLVKAHGKLTGAALVAIEKYGNVVRIVLAIIAAIIVILSNMRGLGD